MTATVGSAFAVGLAVAAWVGVVLLLGELRWFRRLPLGARLAPYAPAPEVRRRVLSGESLREVLAPVAQWLGDGTARVLGVREDVARRLERIHAPVDPAGFRLRQLGWAVATLSAAATVQLVAAAPPVLAVLSVVAAPLLTSLALEQQLIRASEAWQRRLFLELPVVAEQLAILLSAGYSVGAAVNRLATRGQGACARDLERVARRTRQGIDHGQALREWADLARVDSVTRLTAVLTMAGAAADLGRLVADEARTARREVHRALLADVERRAQQVWIPVTVAALVPGVIFLTVPFVNALRMFAA